MGHLSPSISLSAGALLSARIGVGDAAPAAPVHISMQALHEAGGVPPGWQLALQPGDIQGGRQLFVEQGCHT